jgi:hypothetical protein
LAVIDKSGEAGFKQWAVNKRAEDVMDRLKVYTKRGLPSESNRPAERGAKTGVLASAAGTQILKSAASAYVANPSPANMSLLQEAISAAPSAVLSAFMIGGTYAVATHR